MNERISELAKEANANELSYAYYRGEKRPENAVALHSVDLEKFAELIVGECIKVIETNHPEFDCKESADNLIRRAGRMDAIDEISKHFGVEL